MVEEGWFGTGGEGVLGPTEPNPSDYGKVELGPAETEEVVGKGQSSSYHVTSSTVVEYRTFCLSVLPRLDGM